MQTTYNLNCECRQNKKSTLEITPTHINHLTKQQRGEVFRMYETYKASTYPDNHNCNCVDNASGKFDGPEYQDGQPGVEPVNWEKFQHMSKCENYGYVWRSTDTPALGQWEPPHVQTCGAWQNGADCMHMEGYGEIDFLDYIDTPCYIISGWSFVDKDKETHYQLEQDHTQEWYDDDDRIIDAWKKIDPTVETDKFHNGKDLQDIAVLFVLEHDLSHYPMGEEVNVIAITFNNILEIYDYLIDLHPKEWVSYYLEFGHPLSEMQEGGHLASTVQKKYGTTEWDVVLNINNEIVRSVD